MRMLSSDLLTLALSRHLRSMLLFELYSAFFAVFLCGEEIV